ncbi:hypothetical protein MBLNU459_g1412t1 [Dothideomycetes sp. NU459]
MAPSDIPFKSVRVLSFDIYGTLIDWEGGIYKSLQASPLGPHLPSTRKRVLEGFEDCERAVQAEAPSLRQSDVNAEAVRRYAGQLGVVAAGKVSAAEVERGAVEFGASIGSWPAFPDSVAAMQRLAAAGFKLVPLSNIDKVSWAGTMAGPLEGCVFDAVYTAEDIGSYKPDPRNFEYLLEHVKKDFGVEKSGLLHVAQSLFHDHAPAKRFDIVSCWVDRKGIMGARSGKEKTGMAEEYGYALRVDTLAELADIVEKELQ